MKKLVILAASAVFTLAACAGQVHNQQQADEAIAAAKAATKKAAAVGYEWRDTGKMIKKAEEAAKKGEFDAAVKDANKAAKQSEIAVQQHDANKKAGPLF